MSEHTPGPWSLWTSNSVRRISAKGDGDVVCAVRHNDGCADLHFKNGGPEGPDARLIVAAPDLLEACEAFVNAVANHDGSLVSGMQTGCAYEMASAAIAKAKQP